jgi:hypothetical protein
VRARRVAFCRSPIVAPHCYRREALANMADDPGELRVSGEIHLADIRRVSVSSRSFYDLRAGSR